MVGRVADVAVWWCFRYPLPTSTLASSSAGCVFLAKAPRELVDVEITCAVDDFLTSTLFSFMAW